MLAAGCSRTARGDARPVRQPHTAAPIAIAAHAGRGNMRNPSPDEIQAAHPSAPATPADDTTPTSHDRNPPSSSTSSPMTKPNNTPVAYGIAPENSYSPRINAPIAQAPSATTSAPTARGVSSGEPDTGGDYAARPCREGSRAGPRAPR